MFTSVGRLVLICNCQKSERGSNTGANVDFENDYSAGKQEFGLINGTGVGFRRCNQLEERIRSQLDV